MPYNFTAKDMDNTKIVYDYDGGWKPKGRAGASPYMQATFERASLDLAELSRQRPDLSIQMTRCTSEAEKLMGWQSRELDRMNNSDYQTLPAAITNAIVAAIPAYSYDDKLALLHGHYLHVAHDAPEQIAYTENEEKGIADKQTRTRLGRYLEKHFGDVMQPNDLAAISAKFSALTSTSELLFASTADDIENVYRTADGFVSCMSHALENYNSPIHPTRIYAAGDIEIAYAKVGDRITCRAVAWPAKKRYTRIYGDANRLEPLLTSAGFRYSTDFYGARLALVKHRQWYVVPYCDFEDSWARVSDDESCLIIGPDGRLSLGNTGGLSNGNIILCTCCDEGCEPNNYYHTGNDAIICSGCEETEYFTCGSCSSLFHNETATAIYNNNGFGENYCQRCTDRYAVRCEITDEIIPRTESVQLTTGETWSEQYFEENGVHCGACDGRFDSNESAAETCNRGGCQFKVGDLFAETKTETETNEVTQ